VNHKTVTSAAVAALTLAAFADPAAQPLVPGWTPGTPASYTHTLNLNAGEIRWFVINVPYNFGFTFNFNTALHIDTDASPASDTSLAIYNSAGFLHDTDTDSGLGDRARLTYGFDDRPGVGDGLPFDGRNGQLTQGTYYVAVAGGPATFGNYPFLAGTSAPAAQVVLHVEAVTNAIQFSYPPTTAFDCGTVRSTETFGYDNYTIATWHAAITAPGQVAWFRIRNDITTDDNYYFDIDTAGSTVTTTSMALYGYHGVLELADNQGPAPAPGPRTFSFSPSTHRTAPPPGLAPIGQHGTLDSGTHWLAVVPGPATFAHGYGFTPDPAAPPTAGDLQVNIRTNFISPIYYGICARADIGTCGGNHGSDGLLDNNDFISFIDYFFEMDQMADMGAVGGVPEEDGHFDNNDFVVFIDYYFSNASCHG
jgi:hypothetical protein